MDRKEDIQALHILNGTLYATATASAAIDMARHDQCLIGLSITAVATATASFIVQDSADGVTWTNTSYSFSEGAGAVNTTRWIFVREQDVRRYIRVRVSPGASGTATLSGAAVLLGSTQPPAATTFSIDTSAA